SGALPLSRLHSGGRIGWRSMPGILVFGAFQVTSSFPSARSSISNSTGSSACANAVRAPARTHRTAAAMRSVYLARSAISRSVNRSIVDFDGVGGTHARDVFGDALIALRGVEALLDARMDLGKLRHARIEALLDPDEMPSVRRFHRSAPDTRRKRQSLAGERGSEEFFE